MEVQKRTHNAQFSDVKKLYSSLALSQGLNVSDKHVKFTSLRFIYHQISLTQLSTLGLILMVSKHLQDGGHFITDCQTLNIILGQSCMQLSSFILFVNQNNLKKLFSWCETVSNNNELDEEFTLKTVKIFYYLRFLIASSAIFSSVFVGLIVQQKVLPIPFYFVEKYWGSFKGYLTVLILESFGVVSVWQLNCGLLATYFILVQHISQQYVVLSDKVRRATNQRLKTVNVKANGEEIDDIKVEDSLDEIGKLHSELLVTIKETSSIFKVALLFNEALGVICVVLPGIIFQYERKEISFAAAAIIVGIFNLAFPYLGEGVSSRAKEFSMATIENDWINLSNKNRKKLALITMMAQKSVGISTAGFHYSNYLEISQIFKTSYNLLIFIDRAYGKLL